MRGLRNIYNLGVKELRSLLGDKAMLALIVFAFTVSVYSSATVMPGSLHLAPIAVADMDKSQLSSRIINAFYRPWFLEPELITADEMDAGLDAGRYTFAINIPPNFQRDVLADRQPEIQVNVVVFNVPSGDLKSQGELISGQVSCLDAFSTYLFRI